MTTAIAARRADVRFLLAHPAHWIALGLGSGLSPLAPGTVGTLWAWLSFVWLDKWLDAPGWGWLLLVSLVVGWWACTQTARHLGSADPAAIVWDEVIAFWLVLWVASPMSVWGQAFVFVLFRWFDAAKPGPVAWADRVLEPRGGEPLRWRHGLGILLDDLVAALCTLLVLALVQRAGQLW